MFVHLHLGAENKSGYHCHSTYFWPVSPYFSATLWKGTLTTPPYRWRNCSTEEKVITCSSHVMVGLVWSSEHGSLFPQLHLLELKDYGSDLTLYGEACPKPTIYDCVVFTSMAEFKSSADWVKKAWKRKQIDKAANTLQLSEKMLLHWEPVYLSIIMELRIAADEIIYSPFSPLAKSSFCVNSLALCWLAW